MEEYKKLQQPFLDENNEPIQMGVNDNLEKLKALFPNVVKDGFVDFTALKEELGDIEEVGAEKYNLSWYGKQGAKIEAKTTPIGKTLNYKENGNDNFKGATENLYIEGDNLEVLKLLKENYYGKIKMIYIDIKTTQSIQLQTARKGDNTGVLELVAWEAFLFYDEFHQWDTGIISKGVKI